MILNYSLTGNGEPLVLLHGLLGNLQNLNATAKALAESYQVVNLDLRNHGHSPHHPEHHYQAMAADVIETINSIGIDSFSLLGHSMGGKTAMMIAMLYPDRVKKLIVEDIAPVNYPNRHQLIFDGLKSIKLTELNNHQQADNQLSDFVDDVGIRRFLLTNLSKQENSWQWKMNLDGLINQYSQICKFEQPTPKACYTGPVLFIKGAESDYIQAEHQNTIRQLFPCAKAKIIQGAGHWIHAEKPKIFNKVALDFMQK